MLTRPLVCPRHAPAAARRPPLNPSLFLCTLYTSALTTTIVGVLRGIVTILLGFALDTVPFSALNVAGIAINTAGGTWCVRILSNSGHGSVEGRGALYVESTAD